MRFETFSPKQLAALTWWCPGSPAHSFDAIICDGAVRSGKTLCMSVSYVLWAFSRFEGQTFAFCGKTLIALRRNLVRPLTAALREMGFSCTDRISRGFLEIGRGGNIQCFHLFGGRDEGSAALIQGVTLAGVLMDEVALMPRSFVEQALARCSVTGSRFWFNCNPEHPGHWFYREWICGRRDKNAFYLHFIMRDNPALSPEVIRRYETLYTGVFYERFVLGKWVAGNGLVYPMFGPHLILEERPPCSRFFISCDYGTVNPTSMGLWGWDGKRWCRLEEYYYDSAARGGPRTDEEHYRALEELAGGREIEAVIVDPAAASFLEVIRRHGRFIGRAAANQVVDGIRMVSGMLKEEKLVFHRSCRDSIREFSLYRWMEKCGEDRPRKENDHAMDDIRYFVMSQAQRPDRFFATSTARQI